MDSSVVSVVNKIKKTLSQPPLAIGSKKSLSQPPPSLVRRWVIVQLSPTGEREKNLSLIIRSVHKILRKPVEVFIPAISRKIREESEVLFFMEGYVFIEYTSDIEYLRLQDTTYFVSVLCQPILVGGRRQRRYSLLSDQDLKPMRSGIKSMGIAIFKVGDKVKIIKGSFKSLSGFVSVVYEDGQKIQVRTELRSKPFLLEFPITYVTRLAE